MYILIYDVVSDYLYKRVPFREKHLQLIREANQRGELTMAGAFADPADGAVFVFKTDDPAIVEAFVKADPYVVHEIVTGWKIRKWTLVVGA